MSIAPGSAVVDRGEHLIVLGVPPELFLREDQLAIRDDLEPPAGGLDQLDMGRAVPFLECGRQTGGSGTVVSDDAELDRDIHVPSLGTWRTGIKPDHRREGRQW